MNEKPIILVFGATGQQGGSVAKALINSGWVVRAMVRNAKSNASIKLQESGVKLVDGSYDNVASVRSAMKGVYGVFSVQPSSPGGTITDEEEILYGKTVADLALEEGVQHLIYSSGNATGDEPTGLPHYETKAEIERHIRKLPINSTIIKPSTFMELLVMPGFGLNQGRFNFFMKPEDNLQLIAVEDIGKIVNSIFMNPEGFKGKTFEIASDVVTGNKIQELFSISAGRFIPYFRFSDEILSSSSFLSKITELVDNGRLAGKADLDFMRQLNPELMSFKSWLEGPGRGAFENSLNTSGEWELN